MPTRADETIDEAVPQVVFNEFASLRPGDLFLQKDRWVRVLTTEPVKAPAGRRIPDTLKITYRAEATLGSVRSLTDPGDRLVRIVREVHPGDTVISVHDPEKTRSLLVSRDPYDQDGSADVVVAYAGESVTLDRSEIYLFTPTQTGTQP